MLKYTPTALLFAALVGPVGAQEWKLGVAMVGNPGGGIRVNSVFPSSPAESIGLESGCLILTVDGNFVNDPIALRDYILDGRTRVRLVFQNNAGEFKEHDAEFEVIAAAVTAYGKKAGKSVRGAALKAAPKFKLKSVHKRTVSDPRLKAGPKPVLKAGASVKGKMTSLPKVNSLKK